MSGSPILSNGKVVGVHLGWMERKQVNILLNLTPVVNMVDRECLRRKLVSQLCSPLDEEAYDPSSTTDDDDYSHDIRLEKEMIKLFRLGAYDVNVDEERQEYAMRNHREEARRQQEEEDAVVEKMYGNGRPMYHNPDGETWTDSDDDLDDYVLESEEATALAVSIGVREAPLFKFYKSMFTFAAGRVSIGRASNGNFDFTVVVQVKRWMSRAAAKSCLSEKAISFRPATGGYAWPAMGVAAERTSLLYQLNRKVECRKEKLPHSKLVELYRTAVNRLVGMTRDIWSEVPVPGWSQDYIKRATISAMANLGPDKSPGAGPNTLGHLTNKTFLAAHAKEIYESVVTAIETLSMSPHEFKKFYSSASVEQMCEMCVFYPTRTFVKNEPHPKEKAAVNRWRIIFSAFVIKTIVSRVVLGWFIKPMMTHWKASPFKPGMGLDTREDIEALLKLVSELKGTGIWEDVSAWDISTEEVDHMIGYAEYLARVWTLIGAPICLINCMKNLVYTNSRQFMCNSDGSIFELTFDLLQSEEEFTMETPERPWVQCSGDWDTSFRNSVMRVVTMLVVHTLLEAGLIERPFAMGDDAGADLMHTDELPEDYAERVKGAYAQIGKILKFFSYSSQPGVEKPVEFCSHLFLGGQAFFDNIDKFLFRAFTTNMGSEEREQQRRVDCVRLISRLKPEEKQSCIDFCSAEGLDIPFEEVADPVYY